MRSRVLAELVALFAPPGCAVCATPLGDPREAVCPACRRELPWLRGERCPRCALAAPCAPCPAARASFDRAWAPLAYDGPVRALIAALKFDGAVALADVMAAQIAAAAPAGLLGEGPRREGRPGDGKRVGGHASGEAVALVPVPAHPARARARGFDQAERLAAALGRRTGTPVARCLVRGGRAERQLGAARRARVRPGRIEMAVAPPPPAIPRRAVLVDDVHTTGATLEAAARALRAAGARRVDAVTYARTPRP